MATGKRTKHVASRKRQTPSTDADRFLSPEHEAKFDSIFSSRAVIAGRFTLFEELANPSFLTIFEAQGWVDFAKLKVPVYQEMVREFYTNLSIDSSNPDSLSISSYYRSTKIILTETDLATILRVPLDGARISHTAEWPGGDAPSIEDLYLHICETPPNGRNVRFITPIGRVLQLFIRYNVMPSAGHMTDLTNMDIILLSNLINFKKISLPYLIFNHMASKL